MTEVVKEQASQLRSVAEALQAIKEVRREIAWDNYSSSDNNSPNRFWSGFDLDSLILATPDHSGRPEEVAREVYHRLAARFIAARAFELQRQCLVRGMIYAMAGCLVLAITPFTAVSLAVVAPELAKLVGLISPLLFLGLPIGLAIYARNVWNSAPDRMRSIQHGPLKEEALGAVQRCFVSAVPPGTPDDLADVWRHGWYTNEGRPVSSEIVDTDANSLIALETARAWRSCYQALVLCAAVTLIFPCALLILPILFLMLGRGGENPGVTRSKELDRRQAVEGSVLVAAGGIEWSGHQEQARMQQVAEAMKDRTPMFRLGTATGILAARGDSYAPSTGLPFDMSLRDLQNHLVVLGGTGSGKTSGVLRPLAHQIAAKKEVGLVVMDGKSALPGELKELPGMNVIDPAECQFSLVAGLSAAEFVDTLVDVMSTGRESDPYWTNSAAGLLRRAAVVAQHAGGTWWTLDGIAKIATSVDAMEEVKKHLTPDAVVADPLLKEALFFFTREWADMDDKPRSSIVSHAMSWVSTITAHADLYKWATTEDGQDSFDLHGPLHGGRLGFLIPAHRYGRAGAAVTALLKARLYSALKTRAERKLGSDETPVVFVIDEAQEVATGDDATMLSIGRSLGLAMIGATQTVEGIIDKLGDRSAAKWLAVYGSAICLTGKSSATDEFISKRVGAVWKAAIRSVPGVSVKDSITSSVFSGSVAAARRQAVTRQFAVPAPSPIAPFMQRAEQAAGPQKAAMSTDARFHRESDEGLGSSVEPVTLVKPQELQTLLAEPNLALVVAMRGRVPRRDVVKLQPKF